MERELVKGFRVLQKLAWVGGLPIYETFPVNLQQIASGGDCGQINDKQCEKSKIRTTLLPGTVVMDHGAHQ